ncbi:MAG: methyltransferase domain-containing protein [Chitinivibrionales bacterium]|nr:methyltransferase domain-containing protein [Chitinivibrionales bacterium]MBD3358671.1 methyltransferase domain-containing protein [Chitinivibrionales bacterium]
MDKSVFNKFRRIVYEASGIHLNDKKEALVSARVAKRMRRLGFSDHRHYLNYIVDDESGTEIVHLLDAVSTNLTHFFREDHHFKFLAEELSAWHASGQRRFRIWSAGCSTGEEPYSIAVTVLETLEGRNADIRILATDLCTEVLGKAIAGEYSTKKMEKVPGGLRSKYFTKKGRGEAAVYNVGDRLKSMILFKRLNLSVVPYPMSGPMDAVFCRNVMIYFDNQVRRKLLQEFYRLLKPGGCLMVGHAESLTGMLSGFKTIKPSLYRKT